MFKVILFAFIAVCTVVYGDDEGKCGPGITWFLTTYGYPLEVGCGDLLVEGSGNMTAVCDLTSFQRELVGRIDFVDGIKTIGDGVFSGFYYVHSLGLGHVEVIGDHAFSGLRRLTDLEIPKSVKTIGNYAFYENGLTSLTISDSVETIGDRAFFDNRVKTLRIPDSVKTIGENAFFLNSMESLILGESVEVIGDEAFSCNSLKSVRIPNSVKTIGKRAFSPASFYTFIQSVTLGESVEVIGDEAFSRHDLTSLRIPSSVKTIGKDAFSKNPDLRLVVYLGYNDPCSSTEAFSECPKLTQVCVPKGYKSHTFCNKTVHNCDFTKY